MSEERFENESVGMNGSGELDTQDNYRQTETVPEAGSYTSYSAGDRSYTTGSPETGRQTEAVPETGSHTSISAGDGNYTTGSPETGRRTEAFPEGGSAPYNGELQTRDVGSGNHGNYYSYNRGGGYSASGGPGGPGMNTPGPERARSGKSRGPLAMILAVILVFILGAGAGAYVSGRSGSAYISSPEESASKNDEIFPKSGSAEKKESAPEDSKQDKKESTLKKSSGDKKITPVQTVGTVSAEADNGVADVAEQVMPSIVSVYNRYTEQSQFFGRTYTQESESAGSGIIIEEADGELMIVTNNHVVEGADSLSVQFIDEENCEASLKGTDPGSDLAVISVPLDKISEETKKAIAIAKLGDSDTLRIGEKVIAIGNALGYGQSLTVGYVSALNREISDESGITGTFIQTDAAINPGNSGGALLNINGEVIGINSNKIGGSVVEGMGFAIPISKAIPIIDNLKGQESKTKVAEEERGMLGIRGISVTSDVASAYGLPVGAYVEEIIEGSGAADSDLQSGDIITGFNGVEITSMESLQAQLLYYTAGTEVKLTIQHPLDGGKYEEREISLTLSKRSDIQTEGEGEGGFEGPEREEMPSEDDFGSGSGSGSESDYDWFFNFPFGSFGF